MARPFDYEEGAQPVDIQLLLEELQTLILRCQLLYQTLHQTPVASVHLGRLRHSSRSPADDAASDLSLPLNPEKSKASTSNDLLDMPSAVGSNLRAIADSFRTTVVETKSDDCPPSASMTAVATSNTTCSTSSSSSIPKVQKRPYLGLFSLVMNIPPPFSHSLWTAVIFVVGWRIFAKAR